MIAAGACGYHWTSAPRATGGQRLAETPALTTIESRLNPRDPQFQDNARTMRAAVADLREQTARAAQGGGVAARERHLARGKMLPRERVEGLLDPGAPFLELSPMAAQDRKSTRLNSSHV